MTDDAKFWDQTAKKYAAKPIADEDAYRQTLERARAHLSPQDRVREVGCGTGSTALLLAPNVAHITATDISANMIEIARDRARDQEVANATFAQAALPDPNLPDNSYDAILAFNLLHLMRDLPAVLRNLREGIKPGGLLISKTVCLAEQTRLWAIPLVIMRVLGFAPYVNLLTAAELRDAITAADFEIIETAQLPAPLSHFVVARRNLA